MGISPDRLPDLLTFERAHEFIRHLFEILGDQGISADDGSVADLPGRVDHGHVQSNRFTG